MRAFLARDLAGARTPGACVAGVEPRADGGVAPNLTLVMDAFERVHTAVVVLRALLEEGGRLGFDDLDKLERWSLLAVDRVESLGTVLVCEADALGFRGGR